MKKEQTSKLERKVGKIILEVADYFSDYENAKSLPWWSYEVEIPEELRKSESNNIR